VETKAEVYLSTRSWATFITGKPVESEGEAMTDTLERLRKMLNVEILEVEYDGDTIVVYVPRDQVRIAVGTGGAAVKAAELVLGRKIEVRAR